MSHPILRVHPAIGIGRVGNSDEYYLAPESIAALPMRGREGEAETGGLPIRPGTEAETIRSSELRDREGAFKRQAVRFRIYQYPESERGAYPAQDGSEVVIGSEVGGRKVVDIVWTAHLANKKAAWYQSPDETGIGAFENGGTPPLRNLREGLDAHNSLRLTRLIVDAGPRTVSGASDAVVRFDNATTPSYATVERGAVQVDELPAYPVSFPQNHFDDDMLLTPQGNIDTLGDMRTDERGRLIIAGGRGRAVGWYQDRRQWRGVERLNSLPITEPVNNDQWFDDTSDGPVSAWLIFDQGRPLEVHGAWAVFTDPGYAPQTLNVVSLWDDCYNTWIRELDLDPRIYTPEGGYQRDFRPSFPDQLQAFFRAAAMQQWNAYLPPFAIAAHQAVGAIAADDNPDDTILAGLAYIRNPNHPAESQAGAPLMPLSLGDSGKPFLSPSFTQYFFLEQWAAGVFEPGPERPALGFGEYLDKAALANCLGGRFSPGIDMTFIIREPELYIMEWRETGAGPFRIKPKPLDYARPVDGGDYPQTRHFLTLGWVPRHPVAALGLEPGDICKFMAIPWHADYNSCAIHPTDPNPLASNTLYWSWPAQRPVTVYVARDVVDGKLPRQRYSVRGPGTFPGENSPRDKHDVADAGRFWNYNEMLVRWQDIGVIMQATNIDDGRSAEYRADQYLEVESRLEDGPPELAEPEPWPIIAGSGTARRKDR